MQSTNLEKLKEFQAKPHFIASIDVLGYKSMVCRQSERASEITEIIHRHFSNIIKKINDHNELMGDIYGMFDDHNKLKGDIYGMFDVRISTFSDNILISTENQWHKLYTICADLQMEMIQEGLFVRGVLHHGDLYADNDFVFGCGLIAAHEYESKIVVYPRVVLHDTFYNAIEKHARLAKNACIELHNDYFIFKRESEPSDILQQKFMFYNDFDGCKIVDYLSAWEEINIKFPRSEYFSKYREPIVDNHKQKIIANMKNNAKDIKVYEKYQWCKKYHNSFCKKYNDKQMHNISLSINVFA